MNPNERTLGLRAKFSALLGWLSLSSAGLLMLCLALLWCYAFSKGLFPHSNAPVLVRNQVAWGSSPFLIHSVWNLARLAIFAVLAALVSALLNPSLRTGKIGLISALCFILTWVHVTFVED